MPPPAAARLCPAHGASRAPRVVREATSRRLRQPIYRRPGPARPRPTVHPVPTPPPRRPGGDARALRQPISRGVASTAGRPRRAPRRIPRPRVVREATSRRLPNLFLNTSRPGRRSRKHSRRSASSPCQIPGAWRDLLVVMLSSPLDDPRVEALVAWAAGDERPDVAAALASLNDAPPRPECATALGGVAVKAYERVPRVGARDEHLGNAVVAVLGGLGAAGAVELERLWERTSYLRARARIEAALKVARRAAARGEGVPTSPRGARRGSPWRSTASRPCWHPRRTCAACARRGSGPTGAAGEPAGGGGEGVGRRARPAGSRAQAAAGRADRAARRARARAAALPSR